MTWYHPSALFDKIFEAGIVIKGVTGGLEFLGGVLLLFFDPSVMHEFILFVTQKELLQDPHDKIATFLLITTQDLGASGKVFTVAYLWIHAIIKLVAVIGILRNQLWAYPFSLITLGLLMLYQIYSILFVKLSVGMILLTIFDVLIVWLIWREYRKIRTAASDDDHRIHP